MLPESSFFYDFRCDFICAFFFFFASTWVWLGLMLQTCMPLCVCVYMNTHRVRIGQILKEHSRVEFVTILEGKVRVFVPSAVMAFSKDCPLLPVACDCGINYDKQVGTNLIKFWPCFSIFWFTMLYNDRF